MEVLFQIGDTENGFREVWALLEYAGHVEWIWPWCARQIATFGRSSTSSSKQAERFWAAYLEEHPDDVYAELERLLCLWQLRSENVDTGMSFETFKARMGELTRRREFDAALLWDRIGHWAQYDGNWGEAEAAYRKAYDLRPNQYGYCLGTALNFLGRHEEALPILLREAEDHQPDAMSWFQVAVARNGSGDTEGSIEAYRNALELDEDYALAWFNLGGMYWNMQDIERAASTWREAIRRFPDHQNVEMVREYMPSLFGASNDPVD
jgi:tetratricopeptide (TPR) repeat protein